MAVTAEPRSTSARADVVIVGGGLTGSVAAIALARRGLGSVVIERQAFPRDKACGEGLMPHGVARLEALGLHSLLDRTEAQPFRGIIYRCAGIEARGEFAAGATGYGVRRLTLDSLVQEVARASPGVEVVHGRACRLDEEPGAVAVTLEDGRHFTGRAAIGADGARSFVRRAAGLERASRGEARPRYGLRQHFRIAVPMPDHVEVCFEEGHELYLTPTAPGVVGLAALCEREVLREGSGSAEGRLAALIARAPAPLRARLEGARPESEALLVGPLRARARRPARGRIFLAGDAAGYVDAITGEGMSLGIDTAIQAAEAIAAWLGQGLPRDGAVARYTRRRAALVFDHQVLTEAIVLIARRRRLARRVVGSLARDPALFARFLEVNDARRSLFSLGPLDLARLLLGPPPAASYHPPR